MTKQQWKPGEEADKDLELCVVNSNGESIGEITVSKGQRIPPTPIENAVGYIEK